MHMVRLAQLDFNPDDVEPFLDSRGVLKEVCSAAKAFQSLSGLPFFGIPHQRACCVRIHAFSHSADFL
jgi:hypothetical protein